MRSLFVLLAVAAVGLAAEHTLGDTCGQCKSAVRTFVQASADPVKLPQIKAALNQLCQKTSYHMECALLVHKTDAIVKKLQPYLNEETVCNKISMCNNENLSSFHKIAMIYVKQAMDAIDGKETARQEACAECQLAALDMAAIVGDKMRISELKQQLSEHVCSRVPSFTVGCNMIVEEFLPEMVGQLTKMLQMPKQTCSSLGFCEKSNNVIQKKYSPKQTLSSFFKKSQKMTVTSGDQILMSCFECKVLVDTLQIDLEQNKNYQAVADDLRKAACPKLPESMFEGCEDFLTMYAPTVVYMTAFQLDDEDICAKAHFCDASSMSALKTMSAAEISSAKCGACNTFSAFLKHESAQPEFVSELVAAVNAHVCPYAAGFEGLCSAFAESYLPMFVTRARRVLESGSLCTQIAQVC